MQSEEVFRRRHELHAGAGVLWTVTPLPAVRHFQAGLFGACSRLPEVLAIDVTELPLAQRRTPLDSAPLVVASSIGTISGVMLFDLGPARRWPFALGTYFAIGCAIIQSGRTAQPMVCLSKSRMHVLLWCLAFAVLGGAPAGNQS